jgi:hypothetical protein
MLPCCEYLTPQDRNIERETGLALVETSVEPVGHPPGLPSPMQRAVPVSLTPPGDSAQQRGSSSSSSSSTRASVSSLLSDRSPADRTFIYVCSAAAAVSQGLLCHVERMETMHTDNVSDFEVYWNSWPKEDQEFKGRS